MIKTDLNCDMGESFGNYVCGMDEGVVPFISSANVACGFHASDPLVMEKTVALCRKSGVRVGAHPGFPDLVGFGRRQMQVSADELRTMVIYQVGALKAFCEAAGVKLQHVKPHGAMYNMAGKDEVMAAAICAGVKAVDPSLILLGLSGSKLVTEAQRIGLRAAREVFADRAYEEDGSLVARGKPGAMITDEAEAIARVVSMVTKRSVRAITGKEIPIEADSICLHGDSPKAVLFAEKISAALKAEGIAVVPIEEVIA
ncbi:MAG: LamB/YcsF family protein [Schwartzia sp.]|nr:LamB/YcsF family protein [Schwartzia sp. (in: firmicutes)]